MYYDGANWVYDKKEDGVKWCEHITDDMKLKTGFLLRQDVYGSWSFCPLCGTPRPAEKRKLWEAINSSAQISSAHPTGEVYWKQLAIGAIERICEEIDRFSQQRNPYLPTVLDGLKQYLKETLL